MAVKKFYIGTVGPHIYDDTLPIVDPDGDFPGEDFRALVTDGQIYVEQAPTEDFEVVRLIDLSGIVDSIGSKIGTAFLAALNARRDLDILNANVILKTQVFS